MYNFIVFLSWKLFTSHKIEDTESDFIETGAVKQTIVTMSGVASQGDDHEYSNKSTRI